MLASTDTAGISAAVRDGRTFIIRAEYVGANGKNASGRSSKFWIIERPHAGAEIQIRYGRIGSYGQIRNKGIRFYDALDRLAKKEAKGYRVVSRCAEQAHAVAPATKPAPAPAPVVKDRAAAILAWASTLPAPFNTIRALTPEGVATDANGAIVCNLPPAEAARILGSL